MPDATTEALAGTIGLTARMKAAFDAIVAHAGRHGAMPSRRMLAQQLGCAATRSAILITSIVERGALSCDADTGGLQGFGSQGVAVFVPPHIAAQLCAFCDERGENPVSVDAIVLHLDAQVPE